MKIIFFGTAEFSANILQKLIENTSVDVVAVVSQPDKPIWRKKELLPTPVKDLAMQQNIPVYQPESLKNNSEIFDLLSSYQADFFVVVAYGKIIPETILDIPKNMSINIHGSILPLYRWASPIQAAIKNGDSKTWITLIKMSAGMDEWDILSTFEVDVGHTTKTQDLFEIFSNIWGDVLVHTLEKLQKWEIIPVSQDHQKATYCSKIAKEDGQIFFQTQLWQDIYNTWKAYHIWPGIYSYYNEKKIQFLEVDFEVNQSCLDEWFEVWDVVEYEDHGKKQIAILTLDGLLIVKKVKLEWKKEMDILPFVNGNKNFLEYNFK